MVHLAQTWNSQGSYWMDKRVQCGFIYVQNELVAIAELLCDTASIKAMSEGEIAKPSSVIMKADTYPRMWTKSE